MSPRDYLRKMRGGDRGSPPRVGNAEVAWSWLGAFVGIATVAGIGQTVLAGLDLTLMLGSLGASAVLLYGTPRSPFAQPRNLVGGHLLSAIVGVLCWRVLHSYPGLAAALAVSTAIGSREIHDMGFLYVLVPGTLGPLILLIVALVVNNLPASRRYPETWY